jgi:hypothetical protein
LQDCGYIRTNCDYKELYAQISIGCKNAGCSYNESGLCEIANLTYLENPGPGQVAKQVMVNIKEAYSLPMYCRGGEHCCNKDTNCTVGDGDCNRDEDCPGVLVCGKNNCMTGRVPIKMTFTGLTNIKV